MLNKLIDLGFSKVESEELLKISKNIEKDIELLKKGYPIQYLIGYVDFYGNKIIVNQNVLIPRYETELLVDKTIKYIKNMFNEPKVLDLCTGSGAIAISIKKQIKSIVHASDISKEALIVAENNAKENNVEIEFYNDDILTNNYNKYDVIISNPPYVSYEEEIMQTVIDYEPNIALFAKNNGLEFYEKILNQSRKNLNSKYLIAFEIGYKQAKSITEISKKYFPKAKIIVEQDFSGKDRYIFIKSE